MESLHNQQPNDRSDEVSFDPPDDGSGTGGGKTPGSASAGEVSFDPPDDGSGTGGGKTPGSASGSEH